ncbi:MAG: hypothetical protein PHV06_04825 [bacterium]|nr:hypothetical protein [bacterium]
MFKNKIIQTSLIYLSFASLIFLCSSTVSGDEDILFPVHDKSGFFLSFLNPEYPESIFSNPANLSEYNNYLAELGYYSGNPGIYSLKIIIPSDRNGVWGLGIYDNGHSKWDWVNERYVLFENVTTLSYSPNLPIDFINIGFSIGFINYGNDIAFDSPLLNIGFASDFRNRKDWLKDLQLSCSIFNISSSSPSFKYKSGLNFDYEVETIPFDFPNLKVFGFSYNFQLHPQFTVIPGYEYDSEGNHIFIINSRIFNRINFGIGYSDDYLEAVSFRVNFSCFELGYSRDNINEKDYFTFAFKKNFFAEPFSREKKKPSDSSETNLGMTKEEILKKAEDSKRFQDYFEAVFYYRLLVEMEPGNNNYKNALEEAKELTYATWRTNQRFREINTHLSQAQKLMEQEDYKLAEYEFQQVQKLEPENSDAQNGLLEIMEKIKQLTDNERRLAELAFQQKNFPGLIQHTGVILFYDPTNEGAISFLNTAAEYYRKLEEESGTAIKEHDRNIKKIEMLETYISAMSDLEKGDFDSSLKKLNQIKDNSEDNAFILDKINYISRLKNDSADFNSENVLELYREGLEFYTKGEFQNAINKWEEVLKIDPFNTSALRGIQRAKKMLSVQE